MRALEDYFEFQGPNSTRIKGHRIGIERALLIRDRRYEDTRRVSFPDLPK